MFYLMSAQNNAGSSFTCFSKAMSLEAAADNVTINNLLPGFHETDRSITTMKAMAEKNGTTPEAMKAERIGHIPAARIGDPAEEHVQIDGGADRPGGVEDPLQVTDPPGVVGAPGHLTSTARR